MKVVPPEERFRPACYNRAPRAEGRWHFSINSETGEVTKTWLSNEWFQDRCVTHDGVGIGQQNENYPHAHGWICLGCRWYSEVMERGKAKG